MTISRLSRLLSDIVSDPDAYPNLDSFVQQLDTLPILPSLLEIEESKTCARTYTDFNAMLREIIEFGRERENTIFIPCDIPYQLLIGIKDVATNMQWYIRLNRIREANSEFKEAKEAVQYEYKLAQWLNKEVRRCED